MSPTKIYKCVKVLLNWSKVYKDVDDMGRVEYEGNWVEGKKSGKGIIK